MGTDRLVRAGDWNSFRKQLSTEISAEDPYVRGYEDALDRVEEWINTQEAVEVVPCKDCKSGKHPEMTSLVGKYVKCALYNPMPMMRSSDFCSYGKRRTDDGHS